jgi:osmotically inducible protein OsmC
MATERRADAVWEGSLMEGSGTITSTGSGVLPQLPVTWASRAESPEGRTSPEELIAAAHAACFAMALAHALAEAGNPPERLETSATVTFVPGTGITKSALTVKGRVPGIDAQSFQEAAEGARDGCPVSGALKGNVELVLDAEFEA